MNLNEVYAGMHVEARLNGLPARCLIYAIHEDVDLTTYAVEGFCYQTGEGLDALKAQAILDGFPAPNYESVIGRFFVIGPEEVVHPVTEEVTPVLRLTIALLAQESLGASARANHAPWQIRSRIEDVTFHMAGYVGQSDPASGVIALGNWNDCTTYDETSHTFQKIDQHDWWDIFRAILKGMDVECDWSDMFEPCDCCEQLIETQPSSGPSDPSWRDADGALYCEPCTIAHFCDAYLESLKGKSRKALRMAIDLAAHGYQKLDFDFEHGLHYGQADDPKIIARSLRSLGITNFIFEITGIGQFDIEFVVWVHKDEIERFRAESFQHADPTGGPGEHAARALQTMSARPQVRGTTRLSSIGANGTVAQIDIPQQTLQRDPDLLGRIMAQLNRAASAEEDEEDE